MSITRIFTFILYNNYNTPGKHDNSLLIPPWDHLDNTIIKKVSNCAKIYTPNS